MVAVVVIEGVGASDWLKSMECSNNLDGIGTLASRGAANCIGFNFAGDRVLSVKSDTGVAIEVEVGTEFGSSIMSTEVVGDFIAAAVGLWELRISMGRSDASDGIATSIGTDAGDAGVGFRLARD